MLKVGNKLALLAHLPDGFEGGIDENGVPFSRTIPFDSPEIGEYVVASVRTEVVEYDADSPLNASFETETYFTVKGDNREFRFFEPYWMVLSGEGWTREFNLETLRSEMEETYNYGDPLNWDYKKAA